jgi:chromosome segregation ATPase
MTTENQGYIIEVIADLQKRLASESSSNEYLRNSNKELVEQINILNDRVTELEVEKTETDNLLKFSNSQISDLNNQIAEQKETIETLQSSLKNLDAEYISLKFDFNELVKKHQDLDTQYMTLKGLDNGK